MTLRRVPFRRPVYREPSEAELQQKAARLIERAQRQQRNALARRTEQPKQQVIVGKPWPASFMTEAQFQSHVEDVAVKHGWLAWHCVLPVRSRAGFPDLVLIKQRVLWRELKVRDVFGKPNRPAPEQRAFLSALALAGADAKVWLWPDDDDAIFEELAS